LCLPSLSCGCEIGLFPGRAISQMFKFKRNKKEKKRENLSSKEGQGHIFRRLVEVKIEFLSC